MSSTTAASPILRHPDTGCTVTLSAFLTPTGLTHNPARCRCIPVSTPEEIARLAENASRALREGILVSEKPAVTFGMLLLGGQVLYD